MPYKTLLKSLQRELRGSLSRFISIFAISALGGSFFVGLTSIGPDMLLTASHYYDTNRLADYRVLSSFGFTEDDITALRESGVYSAVSAGYGLDVLVEGEQGPVPVRLHSMPLNENDENTLNRPEILEGRYPAAANECLADATSGHAIGDEVVISSENSEDTTDLLHENRFTVVGIAESPYYIYHTRGNTELGDGQLSRFYLVLDSAFDSEFYLEVFLRDAATEGLDSFSDEYEALQTEGEGRLEAFADEREEIRYNEILSEAETELADARAELLDGEEDLLQAREEAELEFADAEAEIAEAEADLSAGQTELEAGRDELVAARTALQNGKNELAAQVALLQSGQSAQMAGETELAAGRTTLETERRTLLDGQAAYEAGLAEYNAGLLEYEAGLAALQAAENDVGALRTQYEAKNSEYLAANTALGTLQTAKGSLQTRYTALEALSPGQEAQYKIVGAEVAVELSAVIAALPADSAQKSSLETALAAINTALLSDDFAVLQNVETELNNTVFPAIDAEITAQTTARDTLKGEADALLAGLQAAEAQLDAQKAPLEAARVQLEQSMGTLQATYIQLQAGVAALAQAEAELAQGEAQLEQSAAQLAQGNAQINAANAGIVSGEAEIVSGEAELLDAEEELQSGWAELMEAREELLEARAEVEAEFADAEAEIADAKAEIEDGEREIADLETPEWFVQTRSGGQPGYSSFANSVDSLRALAGVFPVFFFLVSTLVCLTTMTRMVEDKRTQIGTLKALGYSKAAIAFEYLFYGTVASFTGAVAGAIIGITVFPIIIWEAYSLMYNMPRLSLAVHPVYVPLSIGVSVLSTAGATLAACLGELHSVPATLMRPKAPRAGQRILLARVRPLWKRMNFIQKVTSRNIFRYKKRFLMTIIGVAGCTALLLTGFGLNDTIGRVIPLQFDKINAYDATLVLDNPSSSNEDSELNDVLPSLGEALYVDQFSVEVAFEDTDSGDMAVYLFAPEDPVLFSNFLHFYDVQTEEPFYLDETDGVVITQKLADVLGVETGDVVSLQYDNRPVEATVGGITENYFSNYVYITPTLYEMLLGEEPEFDSVWLKTAEGVDTEQAMQTALETDNVLGGLDSADFRREFSDMMSGLDAVVLLAIVSAGALGVVVLYNLTNINITERQREIATLKVLGFYPREFAAYIYRESFFLTLLGSLLGLVLGVLLHGFVMQAAMVDDLLFSAYIAPISYVLSVVFTLFSLGIVDALMLRNLFAINSVESLKSTE